LKNCQQKRKKEFQMISRLKSMLVCAVCAVGAFFVPSLLLADDPVITPELPTGFDFDVTVLFGGLLGILLPAIAAAIGLAAAVWAVGLIWRKVRGVGV
jgi:hypothetical protein